MDPTDDDLARELSFAQRSIRKGSPAIATGCWKQNMQAFADLGLSHGYQVEFSAGIREGKMSVSMTPRLKRGKPPVQPAREAK